MLTAYVRALGQMLDPRIVRVLGWSVFLSALIFAALWAGMAWLLTQSTVTSWFVLEKILDTLGGVATIVSTFFLFPVVVSAVIGLWLDAVARAVEARHYPGVPPAKGVGLVAGLWTSLRFLLKALLVNVLLLLFLFLPALYPFAWLLGNAYLLGREYFELAALRRVTGGTARELRRRHWLQTLAGGLAAALLFMIPVVNLVAPVLVTMAMVHAFERWQPTARTATPAA